MKMEASDNRATEVVLNEKGFNFVLKPFLEFSGLYSPKNALTILFKKLPHPTLPNLPLLTKHMLIHNDMLETLFE